MTDRLVRVFNTVQERYLRDPAFAGAAAIDWHVGWLRQEQDRVAGDLWDEASAALPYGLHGVEAVRIAMEVHARAEDRVIEREIVGKLPPRLVQEVRNSWAYLEAEVTAPLDPARVDLVPPSGADLERLGNPAYYTGVIEDVAVAPSVHWTEADKKAALERAVGVYDLEPGQWLELEWPPVPHLWDPGIVYTTELEQCATHIEQANDDCPECDASLQEVVEQMAQWKWTTTFRIHEITFDHDGREYSSEVYSDQAFEVAMIEQDPRDIVIGPPGRGQRW